MSQKLAYATCHIRVAVVYKNYVTDRLSAQEAGNGNYLLSTLPFLTNQSSVCQTRVNGELKGNESVLLSKMKRFFVAFCMGLPSQGLFSARGFIFPVAQGGKNPTLVSW